MCRTWSESTKTGFLSNSEIIQSELLVDRILDRRIRHTQIANIIGPTLHIDWVIGVWLRSHVHDWVNVGVVVHSHAIFADVGPILANDLLLQRIMKVIFFHRNISDPIFVSRCNKS